LPILRATIPPWRDPYNILFGSGYAGLGFICVNPRKSASHLNFYFTGIIRFGNHIARNGM